MQEGAATSANSQEPETPTQQRMQGAANAHTEPMPFRSPPGPSFSDGFSFGSMSNSSPIVQEKSWDNTMLALCSLVQEQGARSSYLQNMHFNPAFGTCTLHSTVAIDFEMAMFIQPMKPHVYVSNRIEL